MSDFLRAKIINKLVDLSSNPWHFLSKHLILDIWTQMSGELHIILHLLFLKMQMQSKLKNSYVSPTMKANRKKIVF